MNRKLVWIFAGAFLFRVILAFIVWHPDVNNHIDWGIRFWQYGPARFFAPETNVWSFTWPNQPPGTIYLFAGIRKLFEFLFYGVFSPLHFKLHLFPGSWLLFFESNLYPALLKMPSIFADLGIAYLMYKLTKKLITPVLWLVNPVVWYNSAVWGQTDALINFLALLSFYFLFKKKLIWSVLVLGLSFYTKVSLTIFLPVFAIVALKQKHKVADYVKSIVLLGLVLGIATLPFSSGEPFSWLVNLYQTKILGQQLQIITANAFNLWAAIAGIHELPQSLPFLGLTYQYWGYILFGLAYLPLLHLVWKNQDIKTVVIALALTAFSSWLLLTNMHERYLYPLFPYLTILVGFNLVSIYPYILISLLNLLNLYNFWWVPEISLVKSFLSFGDRLMPRVLGVINLGLFIHLTTVLLGRKKLRIGSGSNVEN